MVAAFGGGGYSGRVWSEPGLALFHPDYLDTVEKVTWYDETFWATATRIQLDNIWYFASRHSVMYKARRRNESNAMPFHLPRFGTGDIVFMPDASTYYSEYSSEWAKAFLEVVSGVVNPRVEHGKSEWTKALSRQNVACFKHAMITGTFGFVVRVSLCCRTSCSGVVVFPPCRCTCVVVSASGASDWRCWCYRGVFFAYGLCSTLCTPLSYSARLRACVRCGRSVAGCRVVGVVWRGCTWWCTAPVD